jgi:hypothetical protein
LREMCTMRFMALLLEKYRSCMRTAGPPRRMMILARSK